MNILCQTVSGKQNCILFGPYFKTAKFLKVVGSVAISTPLNNPEKYNNSAMYNLTIYIALSRLHERAGDDFLHVCPHDEDQMVRSSKRYFNKASMFQQK